jgi:predicted ferric reductase
MQVNLPSASQKFLRSAQDDPLVTTMTSTDSRPTRRTHPVRQALRRGSEYRRWQARVGDLLEAAAVFVLVAIVVQFLVDGGSHDLVTGHAATRLTAVGRLTGLVAMDVLLVQLLLAARVPWVDRVYGLDRALKAHRVLGRVAVPLVLVHVGAIIVGYQLRDRLRGIGGTLNETLQLVTGGNDLLEATIATVLLVAIAVTSVSIARRKMSYEWWHLVHLTAYAAVVLSVPHQLSLGSDFTSSGWAKTYWMALYVVVAASVLWWRLLVPVWRSLRHDLRVTQVVEETPGVWSVWMRGRHMDALPVRAGQYLNWRFLSPRLMLAAHPWSLSSAPDGEALRITVRDLGDHSRELRALRPGTRVLFEGPYGAFTTQGRTRRRVLLVAAGIGITPVRALLEELVRTRHAEPGDVTLVYRANTEQDLAFRRELEQLAASGGHRLLPLIGPPVAGSWLPPAPARAGRDVKRLQALVPKLAAHEAYVCGPAPWMALVDNTLRQGGIPKRHIHDERFSW